MPWKLGVEVNGICGRRREIFLTLWSEVGASNEKSCLWRSVNNACAASFHGLSIIHMCLPFPSSRWVSPCILYRLLLTFVFGGWWAGEYGFSILGVNAILIYLLFHYFIIYLSIYNKIVHDFQIIKLESHSEELDLLKPRYILVASTRSVKYPLTLFRVAVFGAAQGGEAKGPHPENLSHISYNNETWHNYTLPKEDPKNIWITWHHLWVLLTSVFFCRKSAIFAISGNKPLDT